ncbi:MAG TPA: BadF/BadG/BcrA/BcrD ATPase family protein [Armatimonadota bacterium]|nr:BadF/BadG/BcrA/BcrD ATPase family protein [Armatimonadota bacterium]
MSHWWVGVDAGGTHTRAMALSSEGGAAREASAAGANWTVHGAVVCGSHIEAAVAEALPEGEQPAAVCLCIAGYYPPDHRADAEEWARGTWPGAAVRVEPDVLGAWCGALGGEPGLVLVAGTGSICYGRTAGGVEARAGGWGPLFGDAGSGYAVGVGCLRALADAVDGTGSATRLDERLRARWPELGEDLRTWLRGIYRAAWGREQVAALAEEVALAAEDGDAVAVSLLRRAGEDLARMALAVERRLGETTLPLALLGGLGESSTVLRVALGEALRGAGSTLRLTPARFSPLGGALLLATEAAGGPAAMRRLRDRLADLEPGLRFPLEQSQVFRQG